VSGAAVEDPAVVVAHPVVTAAQGDEVRQAGQAALAVGAPPVVVFQVERGAAHHTAVVSGIQGSFERFGDVTAGGGDGSDVDPVGDDQVQIGVAQHGLGGFDRHRPHPGDLTALTSPDISVLEGGQVGEEVDGPMRGCQGVSDLQK
jgi:hypothetical protein